MARLQMETTWGCSVNAAVICQPDAGRHIPDRVVLSAIALNRLAQYDKDVTHVTNNPYVSPNEAAPVAAARPRQRDHLFAAAGCFLVLAVILRKPDWSCLTYFSVVAAVFGLTYSLTPNCKLFGVRAAKAILCGGISGAISGTIRGVSDFGYDLSQPMTATRIALILLLASLFATCGTCIGFICGSLHTDDRRVASNAK